MSETKLQLVRGSVGVRPIRAADIFRSSAPVASGGLSDVWTPPVDKKFLLLWYVIEITADASKAGGGTQVLALTLRDGGNGAGSDMGLIHSAFIPPAAPADATGLCYTTNKVDLGGIGYTSRAVGMVLQIELGFALTTGRVRVRIGGNEVAA